MAGHLPFQASTTTATRYRTCCTLHTRRNQTRCRDTPASPFPFLALVRSAFCATGFALILRPATVVCAHHIKAEGGEGASVRHCACMCLRAVKHPDGGAHARLLRSVVPATAASWWARRRFFPIRKEERAGVENGGREACEAERIEFAVDWCQHWETQHDGGCVCGLRPGCPAPVSDRATCCTDRIDSDGSALVCVCIGDTCSGASG